MTEIKIDGKRDIGSYLANETSLVLVATAATYIFAHVSQRTYLKAFGIDEVFVTIGLEDVVRSGAWLVGFILFYICLLQIPSKHISKLNFAVLLFLPSVVTFGAVTLLYFTVGVKWVTVIFGLIFTLFFCLKLIEIVLFRCKGGTWDEYSQPRVEREKWIIQELAKSKLYDILGKDASALVLLFLLAPYGVGMLVGNYEAKNKDEFLQFSDTDENYIIVHEASGTFVAVGYEDRGTEPAILNSHVKVLLSESLPEIALENRKFDRGSLLLSEPIKLQSFKEWYQHDFPPRFKSSAS